MDKILLPTAESWEKRVIPLEVILRKTNGPVRWVRTGKQAALRDPA